jgi:hypothetical protein
LTAIERMYTPPAALSARPGVSAASAVAPGWAGERDALSDGGGSRRRSIGRND